VIKILLEEVLWAPSGDCRPWLYFATCVTAEMGWADLCRPENLQGGMTGSSYSQSPRDLWCGPEIISFLLAPGIETLKTKPEFNCVDCRNTKKIELQDLSSHLCGSPGAPWEDQALRAENRM
jgi:hypothetical protein